MVKHFAANATYSIPAKHKQSVCSSFFSFNTVHQQVQRTRSSLLFLFIHFVTSSSDFHDILNIRFKGNYGLFAIPEH